MASSSCAPLVEIQLREIEVALGKPRVDLDRLSVGRLLPGRVPELLAQLRQVERRLVGVGLHVDFLLVLSCGRREVAALLRDQREVEVRQRHVRLLRERGCGSPVSAPARSPRFSATTPSALRAAATRVSSDSA